MKGFCPSCEKESELTHIIRVEDFKVKSEIIPVKVELFTCLECGEEFDNPMSEADPYAIAYREYRKRKGMVQPEEIRSLRERYFLTQRELSLLLGFGGATLSRYENDALQDETHDTILRLVMDPKNLLSIVREKGRLLNGDKGGKLVEQLEKEIKEKETLSYLQTRGYGPVDMFSGNKEMSLLRTLCAVKAICYKNNVYKTKLNKLLFYADFKNYEQTGSSITGLRYVHLKHGPVPDQYEIIYEYLLGLDPTLIKEEDPYLDCSAETFRSEGEPDTTMLTFTELSVLGSVKEYFKNFTAKAITEFSHEEEGYKQTREKEFISYEFAKKLKI
jgi:putative zinc finger/helix-turn-helix YgiT family protein